MFEKDYLQGGGGGNFTILGESSMNMHSFLLLWIERKGDIQRFYTFSLCGHVSHAQGRNPRHRVHEFHNLDRRLHGHSYAFSIFKSI